MYFLSAYKIKLGPLVRHTCYMENSFFGLASRVVGVRFGKFAIATGHRITTRSNAAKTKGKKRGVRWRADTGRYRCRRNPPVGSVDAPGGGAHIG